MLRGFDSDLYFDERSGRSHCDRRGASEGLLLLGHRVSEDGYALAPYWDAATVKGLELEDAPRKEHRRVWRRKPLITRQTAQRPFQMDRAVRF